MNNNTVLRYDSPAANWDEALPIGNGRLGGMIFGSPEAELIQLNEDSVWSGGYRCRNNPKALSNLPKIRKLIDDGKLAEAQSVCEDAFYGTNENQRHYQPLGDFHLWQTAGEYFSYSRSLDIANAVSEVSFVSDGVKYVRKVFASHPDEIIAIYLTAEKNGKPSPSVSFTAAIDGRDDNYDKNEAYDSSALIFTVSDGIPYACAIAAAAEGGICRTDANRIICENAESALVVIAAQTSWRTGDYVNKAISQAKTALRRKAVLLKRHITDYKSLYSRCMLELCDNSAGRSSLTTAERLAALKEGKPDNGLVELYFNFSRYLMISGSREGTLPLNLQGIWNKDMWPAWGCKYTVNINTEMNYWGVEMHNLSECHMPLFDHIERMREHGRVTARSMYNCGGSVCHHNTDIWGDTAPQDKWMPATLWPMGLAWLCIHIWEHYLFTLDRRFLAEKYDTMREAAEFFTDFLIEDGSGRIVVSPSVSPENTYIMSDGEKGTLCKGASMDSQILRTLFGAVISASQILDEDKEFACALVKLRDKLPEPHIGKYGQIMEWAEDYDEAEPGHRHISQLFALYPADMISPQKTPELAEAAQATILRRLSHGGGHTGWSRAWIINMWARLHDGERAWENIKALLSYSTNINMLDMHPPFQIDGNFGGGAGIGECLVQSCCGEIALLPALPTDWSSGRISGVRARGAWEIDLEWSNGRAVRAVFTMLCNDEAVRPAELVLRETSACGAPRTITGDGISGGSEKLEAEKSDGVWIVKFNRNLIRIAIDF